MREIFTEEVTAISRVAELENLRAQVKRLRKQIKALLMVIEMKDGPRSIDEDEEREAFPILKAIHGAGADPAE